MSANFTPSLEPYKVTGSFKFWVQHVLPLVYDDSLSYYELLCKVVKYLNDVISNVDGLKVDIDKLLEAYNELQDYVNHYFDNLDIQAEVDKKLDEMAEDGTLSSIINEKLFGGLNQKIEKGLKQVPFVPDGSYREEYLNDIADCISSYFASGVNLASVEGNSNIVPKVAYAYYDSDKGYMGVLGQGDGFVYTDTQNIDGVNYPKAYIDCSQFLSLITKCRNFENSPYKYAFENKSNIDNVTLYEHCLEAGGIDEKPYTFDFFNYIFSARMAYIMNASGNAVRLVSSKTNSNVYTKTEYFNNLEDGDLLFIGNSISYPNRFLNLHHVGIYYKTLTKLNTAAAKYNITLKPVDDDDPTDGYIIHATGTSNVVDNTLRINTYKFYANSLPTTGNRLVYSCKPYSNALNSNKANRMLSFLLSEYNTVGLGNRYGNWNYVRIDRDDVQRWCAGEVTVYGRMLNAGENLNNLRDGYYRCNTMAISNSVLNKPPFAGEYFDIYVVGTDSGDENGYQIAVSSYGEFAFRKKKIDSTVWEVWQIVSGAKNGTVIKTLAPNTTSTTHITFDEPFISVPIITLGLRTNAATDFNLSGCVAKNVTVNGFDLIIYNYSEYDRQCYGCWRAEQPMKVQDATSN